LTGPGAAKLAQARGVQADADRQLERLDAMMRDEGLTLDEWRRRSGGPPQREAEAAAGALADLTAEREQVESVEDIMDATGDFIGRIAELRAGSPVTSPRPRASPQRRPRYAGCSMGSPFTAQTPRPLRAGSTPSCTSARAGAT
jgi:hypothetical protein